MGDIKKGNCFVCGERWGDYLYSTQKEYIMCLAYDHNIKDPVWAKVSNLKGAYKIVVWESGSKVFRGDIWEIPKEIARWINHVNSGKLLPVEKRNRVKEWTIGLKGNIIKKEDYLDFCRMKRRAGSLVL